MNRRPFIVVPLAAAVLLAACGGGTSPSSDVPATGTPVSRPAAATPAPDGTAPASPATTAALPSPGAAAGPVDACALLKADEVATLVEQPTASADANETGPIPTYSCTWSEAKPAAMIPVSVTVSVSPGFVSGSGSSTAFVTAMLQSEGSDPDNAGRVVDGLGEIGIVTSVVKLDAEAKFLRDDSLVVVDYTGEDGVAKQDAVVELARAVDGRLP